MNVLKIDQLRIDGGTQVREVLNTDQVRHYAECMKEGDVFPPMTARFDGSTYWLSGGFHRWHAYKLNGIKDVEVMVEPGTREDAIIDALGSNARHGLPLTRADRRKKVLMALEIEGFDKKSDSEIARICEVSKSFVASIRRPEVKERQQENMARHVEKKAKRSLTTEPDNRSLTTPESTTPNPHDGEVPDEAELAATELAHQADIETMHKLLEADEPLKVAHEEIKRLTFLNAQLEVRINGLMAEKNEAIKMVKDLQKKLKKLTKE